MIQKYVSSVVVRLKGDGMSFYESSVEVFCST